MIKGTELLAMGWPQGGLIGMALAVVFHLEAEGKSDEEIAVLLEDVRQFPERHAADAEPIAALAAAWLKFSRAPKEHEVRNTPLDAPIWGADIIDQQAIDQLQNAMRLPVTVGGALMPDAHVGYGIPIGGVVALENAVAPYMVGVDIACRMMMSIYPASAGEMFDNVTTRDQLRRALKEETRFGIGAQFGKYDRRTHDVLDDDAWEATRLLKHLKDKAFAQLGTSGSGNHFVDAGILEIDADSPGGLGLEPGRYLAIMSHSGSRGVGANIADYYSKLAQKVTPLPDKLRHLAWLPLSSQEGEEYWISMNLAGRFASACHHTIHRAIGKRLGERPLVQVENHHNFAWEEEWRGRKVIVHRKGATPAHEGVLGIIPGSQGHDSFIVRGKGSEDSINSASHGAGRQMSRKAAKERIPKRERDAWLKQQNVELLAGGMDEAPQAYKNIHEVLALQTDLVEPIATFKPRIVLMSDDGKSED
jgi:tRNA-splicing ligase RtcB